MVVRTIEPLRQFREAVYQVFAPSRDAAFELIDAIAYSRDARSAVEVSLSPTMERGFGSLYKGLERTRVDWEQLHPLLVGEAERGGDLLFDGWLLYALDHSPYPRPSAPTVSDRGFVHGANGVEVGHQYSLLGRVMHERGSWVGLVDWERIATHQTPTAVGATQIARLKLRRQQRRIISADSEYVTDATLDEDDAETRLLIRFRGNRKLFRAPKPKPPSQRGPQPQHDEKLKLNQAETLQAPDRTYQIAQPHRARRALDDARHARLLAVVAGRATGARPLPPVGEADADRYAADPRTGATGLRTAISGGWESGAFPQSAGNCARTPQRLPSGSASAL